jgi:hypothetical protein
VTAPVVAVEGIPEELDAEAVAFLVIAGSIERRRASSWS